MFDPYGSSQYRWTLLTVLIVLLMAVLFIPAQVFAAQAAIPLTTSSGVCTFNATSVSATPGAFAATGAFGQGCPGVAVTPPPTTTPPPTAACGATPASRTATLKEKFIPSNLARVIDATNYDALFGSVPGTGGAAGYAPPLPWPGYGGNVTVLTFTSYGTYASLQFRTPSTLTLKRAGAWAYAGTGSSTTGTMSISECPGVFDSASQGYCWGSGGEGHGVSYGNAAANARFTCGLKPDTVYYLNLRPTPGQTCGGGVCSLSIVHSIYAL